MKENDAIEALQIPSNAILALSLTIHVSTFIMKRYPALYDLVFVLHFITFVPFAIMIVFLRRNAHCSTPVTFLRDMLPRIKITWIFLVIVLFVYGIGNFFYHSSRVSGNPMKENGKYILFNHGAVTEISELQYHRYKCLYLRIFSGHWLLFSIIPLLYFRTLREIKLYKPNSERG